MPGEPQHEPDRPVPLVIDLDHALLRGGLPWETGMALASSQPLRLLKTFGRAFQGKAALANRLTHASNIDVTTLPYDSQVIGLIETARARGQAVILATARDPALATRIADHLHLFDQVVATQGNRDSLMLAYGAKGFDYAGCSGEDIPVLAAARNAYLVNPGKGVAQRAQAAGNVSGIMLSKPPNAGEWIRALRMLQWTKNVLIFVPLLAAHQVLNPLLWWQGLLAFLFFSLCASSAYLLNDLLDLDADRHHHTKKFRSFAAGRLSIASGLAAAPLLLALALGGAYLLLPAAFAAALLFYYVLTLAYSLWLKHQIAIDVIALAMLYTLRIVAGAAALSLPLTFWMLAFSMFLFLSLALVKRHVELRGLDEAGIARKAGGRDYNPGDLGVILALGSAAGYLSVLVLALYIHDSSTATLYSYPYLAWLLCPILLFWITRIWMLAHRGKVLEDPVVFTLRDRTSLVTGAMFFLVFLLAL